jgi:hypothetical protein
MQRIPGFLIIIGLILAGTDGDYFPWLNIAGCVLMAGGPVFAGRICHGKKMFRHIRGFRAGRHPG